MFKWHEYFYYEERLFDFILEFSNIKQRVCFKVLKILTFEKKSLSWMLLYDYYNKFCGNHTCFHQVLHVYYLKTAAKFCKWIHVY